MALVARLATARVGVHYHDTTSESAPPPRLRRPSGSTDISATTWPSARRLSLAVSEEMGSNTGELETTLTRYLRACVGGQDFSPSRQTACFRPRPVWRPRSLFVVSWPPLWVDTRVARISPRGIFHKSSVTRISLGGPRKWGAQARSATLNQTPCVYCSCPFLDGKFPLRLSGPFWAC